MLNNLPRVTELLVVKLRLNPGFLALEFMFLTIILLLQLMRFGNKVRLES